MKLRCFYNFISISIFSKLKSIAERERLHHFQRLRQPLPLFRRGRSRSWWRKKKACNLCAERSTKPDQTVIRPYNTISLCDPRQPTRPNRNPTKPKSWMDGIGLRYKHLGFGLFGIFEPETNQNRPMLTPIKERVLEDFKIFFTSSLL